MKEIKEDNINHPSHYTTGKVEVINYIEDKLTKDEFQGYLQGNILKYVSRWKHKGGLEDLKKANWYLLKLIENEKQQMNTAYEKSAFEMKNINEIGV